MLYLDHAATTPLRPEVLDVLQATLAKDFGNPSSLHRLGVRAENLLRKAREQVAEALGARPAEVIFTSGATEANNMAIKGLAWAQRARGRHIVTSAVEHPSVLEACRALRDEGFEITEVKPGRDGRVEAAAVAEAVREDTVLVSLQLVNNETGAIHPVAEVGRFLASRRPRPRFHVDAVQALGKVELDLTRWGVDAASFSAHKLHGPKGVGCLFLREGVALRPLLHGGNQERGLRSGTENVAGAVAFAEAAALAHRELPESSAKLRRMRRALVEAVRQRLPEVHVNGPEAEEHVAPHILSLSFPGLRGEVLVHALEERGVYVSTGSACSSRKATASHVLVAMGLEETLREGTIRLSLSPLQEEEHVERAVEALAGAVAELRAFMGAGR